MRGLLVVVVGSMCLLGCHESRTIEADGPDEPVVPADLVEPGESTSALIGREGGTLRLGGLTVEIPARALNEPTEIRATATNADVPPGFTAFSPVIRFEPEGTRFERPIRVSVPFEGDTRIATLFWTREGGSEYTALGTEVRGNSAFGENNHFSQVFVGSACNGEGCCRRATDALDVLFMVDNSGSMSQEQAALAEQIPRLVRAFATGDVDGDGVQDFPAVASLQIGAVTADMGTGGHLVATCDEPNFGDDGVLRTRGSAAMSGCESSYPAIQEHRDAAAEPDAFARDVSCVARAGTNGCGFEQQLEAILKAVTPSSAATTFHASSAGHGDGDNDGLVRDGAVLALVSLTDEDDCSALDPELYDQASSRYEGDLNLRCFNYPEALHSIERYAQGLASVKADPSLLVYATIAGVPPELERSDYDTILASRQMEERVDWFLPTTLVASCETPGVGKAFPPRRLVETARQLEALGVSTAIGSVCSTDYSGIVGRIVAQVADRVAGRCE